MSDKQKNKLIPKLRFPEFKDGGEWEEKKLGDKSVSKIIMGSSPKSLYYNKQKKGLPLIQGNADIENRLSSPRIYTAQITKECKIDDILLSVRAPVGKVAKSIHNACIGRGIAAIRAVDNTSQSFLYQLLLKYEDFWGKISQGAAFDAVNSEDIRNFSVYFPSLPEQQKIADFLSNLDELIEAHKQKLELLKQHKKGLMQNLFPQEGEKVPKFRFPEFRDSGEWVEKKLGEICNVNPKVKVLPDEFVYIDLESVSNGVLLKKKIIKKEGAPSRAQRFLQEKDVIFQMVRPYQKNNYFCVQCNDYEYVASTGYAQLRAYDSSKFLFQLIHTDRFVSNVLEKCTGSNYPAINSNALKQIKVQIPPNKQEQQKIASCLSSVDEIITAETEKIEQLEKHKKGLMQGLFPITNYE